MRGFRNNREGQLLLTSGIILAVLLMVMTTINTDSANTIRNVNHYPSIPNSEVNDVANRFEKSVALTAERNTYKMQNIEAIQKAFVTCSSDFKALLLNRNILFSASRSNITIASPMYYMKVTITMVYLDGDLTSSITNTYNWNLMLS